MKHLEVLGIIIIVSVGVGFFSAVIVGIINIFKK